jgi:hypothetical protein
VLSSTLVLARVVNGVPDPRTILKRTDRRPLRGTAMNHAGFVAVKFQQNLPFFLFFPSLFSFPSFFSLLLFLFSFLLSLRKILRDELFIVDDETKMNGDFSKKMKL